MNVPNTELVELYGTDPALNKEAGLGTLAKTLAKALLAAGYVKGTKKALERPAKAEAAAQQINEEARVLEARKMDQARENANYTRAPMMVEMAEGGVAAAGRDGGMGVGMVRLASVQYAEEIGQELAKEAFLGTALKTVGRGLLRGGAKAGPKPFLRGAGGRTLTRGAPKMTAPPMKAPGGLVSATSSTSRSGGNVARGTLVAPPKQTPTAPTLGPPNRSPVQGGQKVVGGWAPNQIKPSGGGGVPKAPVTAPQGPPPGYVGSPKLPAVQNRAQAAAAGSKPAKTTAQTGGLQSAAEAGTPNKKQPLLSWGTKAKLLGGAGILGTAYVGNKVLDAGLTAFSQPTSNYTYGGGSPRLSYNTNQFGYPQY